MKKTNFTGTGVALVTPFRKDRSIDFAALKKLVEHVISGGVDFLVVMGTTGEAATLSNDEKNAVLSYVIDINDGKLPIVVGKGGNDTQSLVNDIKNTDFTGVDAILSVTPYYNKPTQDGLYIHYKSVSAASPVPVILYNVPGRTSINITAETTLKLAKDFDNIIAIKEASANFSQIMQIIKNKPKDFLVLSGDDDLTLPLISIGVKGAISVTANAFPKEYSEMINLALKNSIPSARKNHYKLIDFTNSIFTEGNPGGIKAALAQLGIATKYVRPPLATVSKKLINNLEKCIKLINE